MEGSLRTKWLLLNCLQSSSKSLFWWKALWDVKPEPLKRGDTLSKSLFWWKALWVLNSPHIAIVARSKSLFWWKALWVDNLPCINIREGKASKSLFWWKALWGLKYFIILLISESKSLFWWKALWVELLRKEKRERSLNPCSDGRLSEIHYRGNILYRSLESKSLFWWKALWAHWWDWTK